MEYTSSGQRHSKPTRIAHMALAVAIVTQLISSLVMIPPLDGNTADFAFAVHKYAGIAAFVAALAFWLVIASRRRGTHALSLFPWFSRKRLSLLANDLRDHGAAISRFHIPDYRAENPLASAVHGLGLLLMTGMAATGVAFLVAARSGLGEETAWVTADLQLHVLFANVVWAYLIGHAALAVVHQIVSKRSLMEMWSLRPDAGAPVTEVQGN
jgi:cytochrome b561